MTPVGAASSRESARKITALSGLCARRAGPFAASRRSYGGARSLVGAASSREGGRKITALSGLYARPTGLLVAVRRACGSDNVEVPMTVSCFDE